MNTLGTPKTMELLQELPDTIRKIIIQKLGQDISELPSELENIERKYKDTILTLFGECLKDPETIPQVRYELETYTNDLNPGFSEKFIAENQGKLVRILDVGAGPGDVTLRSYKKLLQAGLIPQIFALERSQKFRSKLGTTAREEGIISQARQEVLGTPQYPGIFPMNLDIRNLRREYLGQVDLIVGNYVLDRVPQNQLVRDIIKKGIGNIQFTNCVPLQYQNPNTGQGYIPESEIVISEGAQDLSEIGEALGMTNPEQFYGTNIVTSLQDGEEKFEYAGIRGSL